jgi:hypothetical protein
MVAAMLLGMAVLSLPAGAALGALGTSMSELNRDAPAISLLLMAVTMTVPMVGWMRYRGHGWQASAEMAASMFVPALGVIVLLWVGLVEDLETLMAIEHIVMFPGMLLVMLLRRDEYGRGHARVPVVAAGPTG